MHAFYPAQCEPPCCSCLRPRRDLDPGCMGAHTVRFQDNLHPPAPSLSHVIAIVCSFPCLLSGQRPGGRGRFSLLIPASPGPCGDDERSDERTNSQGRWQGLGPRRGVGRLPGLRSFLPPCVCLWEEGLAEAQQVECVTVGMPSCYELSGSRWP